MLYKELYKESNELAEERFALVRERIAEIEEKPETEENIKNISDRQHSYCRNRRLFTICGQMMRFKSGV